jgi:hypothetical protein
MSRKYGRNSDFPSDRVIGLDSVTLSDVTLAWVRVAFNLALVVLLVGGVAFFLVHGYIVYSQVRRQTLQVHRDKVDLWANFCDHMMAPADRKARHECVEAKEVLQRNIEYEILEKVITHHLDEIPGVRYCKTHHVCRDLLVLGFDTLRTSVIWFSIALVVVGGIVLLCLYKGPVTSTMTACRRQRQYKEAQTVGLPTYAETNMLPANDVTNKKKQQ